MTTSSHALDELITTPQQDQALLNIFRYPLTIIAAPDGYRKVSILRHFAAQHGALFVWVRLFWSQESGEGFWREFVTAIGKLSPTVAREMSKFQYPDSFEACSTVVGLLEGLCRDGHLVIVLEDFDRVETQRVDKLLQRMLQCASSQFHLVTISQSPPLLYSDGYLLFPDCNFIGKDILQFSREQTDRLATSLNKRYAASDSFWLAEYAGGWPHLIVYILSESRDKVLNRYYAARLASQMYRIAFSRELDPQMADILLVLCELQQFTLEDAIEILDKYEDADTIHQWLDTLAAETVFLSRQETTYTMCPSAVEFLQEESRKVHSSMVRIGLQNIALKYFSAGSPSLAISLLFRHHDLDGLLSLLDQHVVEEFSELVITTLFQCSEDIGIPQMAVHPIAVCQIAFILLKSDLYAQTGIRLLESLREYTLHTETLSYDREAVLGQIELTLANRQSGQIYSKGLIRLTAASPQGGVYPSWIAPSLLGSVHSSVGSMVEEVAAFQSLCASDGADYLSPIKCANITQAEYQLETGYPSKAIYYALESITDSDRKSASLISLYAYFIIGKASIMNGDPAKAEELADRIGSMFSSSRDARLSSLSDICRGYIYTCLGQWEKVPEWIHSEHANRLSQHSSYAYIIIGRMMLHRKDFIGFEMMSKQWLKVLKSSSNLLTEIHHRIEKAISAYALYGTAQAVTELSAALSLALPDEICAPFAENGKKLLPILQYAIANHFIDLPLSYSDRLNSLMSHVICSPTDITGEGASLTPREKEILSLLCKGMNYREIANTLVISQFTVRKHIQNIYAKLNVSDRVNALIRGKEILFDSDL